MTIWNKSLIIFNCMLTVLNCFVGKFDIACLFAIFALFFLLKGIWPHINTIRHLVFVGNIEFCEEGYLKNLLKAGFNLENSSIKGRFYAMDDTIWFRDMEGKQLFGLNKEGFFPYALTEKPNYLLNMSRAQLIRAFQIAKRYYPNEFK